MSFHAFQINKNPKFVFVEICITFQNYEGNQNANKAAIVYDHVASKWRAKVEGFVRKIFENVPEQQPSVIVWKTESNMDFLSGNALWESLSFLPRVL